MIKRTTDALKSWAKSLKLEIYTLYAAIRDPRIPTSVRYFALFVVGYALSPIDLIPDFIPVLGLLDDLILLPLGIALLRRMIPDVVMAASRKRAEALMRSGLPASRNAAMLIMAVWALVLSASIWWFANRLISPPVNTFDGQSTPASTSTSPGTRPSSGNKRDRSRSRDKLSD